MGVDTRNYSHSNPYNPYPSSSYAAPPRPRKRNLASGSRATPIDLTTDAPPKRKNKRKSTGDAENDLEKPAKKKAKSKDEEKRLKRFRPRAPNAFQDISHRALSQRFFVIDRQRHEPKQEPGALVPHPTETIKLAGTTGNIYTITVDRHLSCDCPYARKGHQCKHVVYVLARVLRARSDLQYQLALLSNELVEIFEKAPPLPSETGDESAKDGNRKPLEDDCPICCEEFEKDEDIVWCKAACGNNIHKECFQQWARTKSPVTCPFCRTPWQADEDSAKNISRCGEVNSEGYVNVAGQLGISGQRDYSTYNEYWVRSQGYDNWY